jgi:hypothetical protein
MAPHWKLTVDGLGKIQHAEVDVRPLTLFVGPNNSGKSELASLLWGLVAMQGDLEPPEGPEREACDAWILARLPKDEIPGDVTLSPTDVELFGNLFNAALDAKRRSMGEEDLRLRGHADRQSVLPKRVYRQST